MRRVLGSALLAGTLALGLAGCGGDSAVDPGTSASSPTGDLTAEPAPEHELVEMVTATAAGGQVGSATALPDAAAVVEFAAQFESDNLGTSLLELVRSTEVPSGTVAYAAVVAIGCDAPTDVTVTEAGGSLVVEAVPVPAPKPECLAPMTTVAFLLVPASAV